MLKAVQHQAIGCQHVDARRADRAVGSTTTRAAGGGLISDFIGSLAGRGA
jgi:hypothetical protein